MRSKTLRRLLAAATLSAALTAPAVASANAVPITGVSAQPKIPGIPVPNVLSPGFAVHTVADGTFPLENPADLAANPVTGIPAPASPVKITNYGFYGDGPLVAGSGTVATLSEPDKNTYLKFKAGQIKGPDAVYDYGRRFLFQGHEAGPGNSGYLTRINLDADYAHHVTLLASKDDKGNQIPAIDGSIWNPFAQRLLFSGEEGNKLGGIWQSTPSYPASVQDLSGVFGRGGYEGISLDPSGNVWLVEDSGGASPSSASALDNARQPNSFLYRLVPSDKSDLTKGGKLQVLQVASKRTGNPPIVFNACPAPATDACLEADVKSQDVSDLHTPGKVFDTKWVTIHDTAVNGIADFDANALAKKKGGTPLKRPENGAFRPGGGFKEFFFTETGDTDATKGSGAAFGQFGAIFKLTQAKASGDTGKLSVFYVGDVDHAAFDNINFLTRDQVMTVEDGGDTLHTQRGKADSAYVLDATAATPAPVRFIAQGRDAVATLRNADNEITGNYIADGDTSVPGLLGTSSPEPFKKGSPWRVFFTNQHGLNVTQEIVADTSERD